VTSCYKCNTKKAGRTPEEAGMHLIRKPVAPKVDSTIERELITRLRNLKYIPHKAWKDYIYWNVELKAE
jgi:hypothetical protein